MKIFHIVSLIILVFLSISSAVTKILLMQQDVEFFAQFGFTNPLLIALGLTQLVGGILLILPKSRIAGALVVAITFLISFIALVMAGNVTVAVITLVFVALLGYIIKQTLNAGMPNSSLNMNDDA
jgi:hypothetical protein